MALPRSLGRAAVLGIAAPFVLVLLAATTTRGDDGAASAAPSGGVPSGAPGLSASAQPSLPPACVAPLQAVIDGAAAGSTVRLPACTSSASLRIDRPLHIDAHGTAIDGQDRLQYAVTVTADDVEIDGLTVVRAANPVQDGAVHAWDVDRFAFRDGWIGGSAGACISVARGTGSAITGSTLTGCGQEGLHATQADGLVVRDDTITANNPLGAYDPEWEAGGAKVTRSTGVVFEGNVVSGNDGPGIWCDIDCRQLTVHANRVSDNVRAGIQVEISDGATVTDNVAWDNGWGKPAWGWGAGILVSSSRNVAVDRNVVAWNADGIVIVSQDRNDAPGPATGNRTSGNVVAAETGYQAFGEAWLLDWSGGLLDPASGNGGSGDRFWFTRPEDVDARFAWGREYARLEPFRATPGGTDDRYLTDAELSAALVAAGVPGRPAVTHPTAPQAGRSPVVPLAIGLIASIVIVVAIAAHARRRRRRQSTAGETP